MLAKPQKDYLKAVAKGELCSALYEVCNRRTLLSRRFMAAPDVSNPEEKDRRILSPSETHLLSDQDFDQYLELSANFYDKMFPDPQLDPCKLRGDIYDAETALIEWGKDLLVSLGAYTQEIDLVFRQASYNRVTMDRLIAQLMSLKEEGGSQ